jgi:hypothetical protein
MMLSSPPRSWSSQKFVDPLVAVLFGQQDALVAGAGDPRGPRQGAQVVNAEDDRRPCS